MKNKNKNKNSKDVSPEDILELCSEIHRNPDDFIDGDIEERIFKASSYMLISINPNEIENEWSIEEYLVEKYMEMSPATIPPIVLLQYPSGRYSIVDGSHRLESFKRKGLKKIPAYIGEVD